MEALLELGLFAGKLVLFLMAAGAFVAMVASAKDQTPKSGRLKITDWGRRWNGYAVQLKSAAGTPKKTLKKSLKADKAKAKESKPVTWVLSFNGDVRASETKQLRQAISGVIAAADDQDEVVVRLKSPGGGVTDYGLAASQLVRLRDQGLSLTVAVEGVAASGGYMMACIANHILAAPFSAVGSIGVVAQMPNIHRALKKADIDVELVTAGKHKRTLTVLGENTDEGREKFKQDLEGIHRLFKSFVSTYRPQLDLDKVADGDVWFGDDALDVGLVDEIGQVDDWLMAKTADRKVLEVRFEPPQNFTRKLALSAEKGVTWLKSMAGR